MAKAAPAAKAGPSNPLPLILALLVIVTVLFGAVHPTPGGVWHSITRAISGGHNLVTGGKQAPPADVAALTVRPAGTLNGYSRKAFGQTWADVDRNGCDTRNDILRRDLTLITIKDNTRGCVVIAGALHDRYTGHLIQFAKADAAKVQIDHVVPLAAAWRSGAATWTLRQRTAFANDPANLLAVDGPTNEAKGDDTPDQWMPPRKSEACDYGRRYVAVKAKYHLSVTGRERDALTAALRAC
jgi:hypothetical protein